MKITVIGTGYVGLVTGVCLAETANDVICVDIDQNKVDKLNRKELYIYEPNLEQLFKRAVKENKIRFTTDLHMALEHADIIFLALPTPAGEDGSADLKYVLQIAEDIGKIIRSYKIIVNKSTVPVGTSISVKEKIQLNYKGEFDVVSNPEFLREGNAVVDFMKPSRVVIGTQSKKAQEIMTTLYEPYVQQGNTILIMDEKSAELTKYAANSFLATKISFVNEIAQFAEKVGADMDFVRKGMGLDERIGSSFLYSGIGYGGSCFPKDVQSMIYQQQQAGCKPSITKAVHQLNQEQRMIFFNKIKAYFGTLKGLHIAIWGLSFKPNTDDIREAPALDYIRLSLQERATVCVFDPEATEAVKVIFKDQIAYADYSMSTLKGADALIICTEWREFAAPDFDEVKSLLKKPIIFDGRNMYKIHNMRQLPFDYISIGRPAIYNYSHPQ